MAFSGIQSYLAQLTPNVTIQISEFEIDIGKTNNGFVTLSIKEWFLLSNFISELDAKVKCFTLLFGGKPGNGTHLYEKFLSQKISAGVTMGEKKAQVFIKTHGLEPDCSCFDTSYSIFLNEDDFQALRWHQLDINNFIEAMPAVHQENKVHKSGDKKYAGCKLCFEVFRRTLDPVAIEERLKAKTRREEKKIAFLANLEYIDYTNDKGEQKKKAVIVNEAQPETTEL